MLSRVTAKNVGDVFFTDTVYVEQRQAGLRGLLSSITSIAIYYDYPAPSSPLPFPNDVHFTVPRRVEGYLTLDFFLQCIVFTLSL